MTTYRYRSAVTGRFVKAGYAKRYPHLTVREGDMRSVRLCARDLVVALAPLIAAQAGRAGIATPFGSQNYRPK